MIIKELQVRGKQARYVLFFLAEIYYDEYVFHHSWRGTRLLAEGVYRGWWFRRLDRAGSMQF